MSTFPNPTLAEIKSHSRKLCQTDWNELKEMYQGKDPYTPKGMMKGRCFDAALVVSLLQNFGFSEDERVFTFIVERNGIEADWTYGAALTILLQGKEEEEEEEEEEENVHNQDPAAAASAPHKQPILHTEERAKERTFQRTTTTWISLPSVIFMAATLVCSIITSKRLWKRNALKLRHQDE